ncbi:multidrug and toxin extrusion protein 1-like [Heterodontus francisci]|uniref:multidrug and toxin extrusion protein 1-like n=1 Tax=Heterodontus francisci TaxID=7792 RepID=UPI00355B3A95
MFTGNQDVESVWVEIRNSKGKKSLVRVIYRSPNRSSAVAETLNQYFASVFTVEDTSTILIVTDLILMITCFPCWAIFINIEHILLAIKQSPAVAKLTQLYVMIFIPGLPATFLYELEIRYLQNQGIILPQLFTGFIANIFNAIINYLFLFVLMLGVPGSAAANVVSQYCQVILLFVYIRWKKLYVGTWAGWSPDSLQEWGHFIRLAIPRMIMLCIDWWTYYIGTFLAEPEPYDQWMNEVDIWTSIGLGIVASYPK